MDTLPKVLVVGINPWIDNTGINTLINFFEKWDPNKLAHIYTRSSLPNTKICNNFFQISENLVIKSVIKRNIKVGKIVFNANEKKKSKNEINEKKKYAFFRKHRSYIVLLVRDIFWKFGKWKSKELNEFVDSYNPDVLFIPIYAYSYMAMLQLYIIKRCKKPVITYIADDVYSYKSEKGSILFYIYRFFLRKSIKKLMKYNNQLFVIAPKLKNEYDKIFKTNSDILTKGIDFTHLTYTKKQINKPIKLVYTGKTNIGRWYSLSLLANAINEINIKSNKIKLFLEIYTKDELSNKVSKALNIQNASKVMGSLTLEESLEIQKKADILVFAESLQWRYKDLARLSFSTKLTDYFANGKCILAIGDKNIAPIEYLKENNCALICSNYKEIISNLNVVVKNETIINKYSELGFNIGKLNHNKSSINKKLMNCIKKLQGDIYE
ncbi:hypothetical protein [Thomasclavelia spiroformis]|uniref:hypothetical protein n=1 Tax=Thomasclavelia spiroformis TaxID=29348 RepID=UPI000B39B374|nr:hypothetical protein [Thomasclavelia spiroformis]OUO70299.1 hypothetical protein B5F64_06510 [Thomasclavelia spiroformis]